jgi:putative ABC transport system permease protein
VIVRLIMEQSLVITIAAFGFAYVLVELTYDRFPRTLVLLPEETLITFAAMFMGGVLASLLGIWLAMRTPPSLALGG